MPSTAQPSDLMALARKDRALQATDLRRLAAVFHAELGSVLECLHDLEGVKALKAKLQTNQSFLKALAIIPDNGFVIAVTGLQGVGKSTLANALLGLSGNACALPEGLMRCEKVPVLVRTLLPGERQQAHVLPLRFEGDAARNLVPVNAETAIKVATDGHLQDGREAILVDYPLPASADSPLPPLVYLLVLPGYEKKSAWGDLALASMLLADRAVFVVDGSALAAQSNKALLAQAVAQFGGEGLAVVISKADRAGLKPEEFATSLNALSLGRFSAEMGNLYFTGVKSNRPEDWLGIAPLRDGLFYGLDRSMVTARDSRVRQLATRLKDFAEDEVEDLILAVREQVETSQAEQAPNQRIHGSIQSKVAEAKAIAVKQARLAIAAKVDTVFKTLPEAVEQEIYTAASGTKAFFEQFNPFQDYGDQQDVVLNRRLRDMVNSALGTIPSEAMSAALTAFRDNLPESLFADQSDANWAEMICFKGDLATDEQRQNVSSELLAALRPVTSVMIDILERAMKGGKLDKDSLAAIGQEVIATSAVQNLRRGMVALGLLDAGLVGEKIAEGSAASTATAISVPLAATVSVVLVLIATALSLRAAKNYKVMAQKQAGYLVSSSQEPIKQKMLEAINPVLDWFERGLNQFLSVQLGLKRQENVQYRLAIQCERLSVLRSATLKTLSALTPLA